MTRPSVDSVSFCSFLGIATHTFTCGTTTTTLSAIKELSLQQLSLHDEFCFGERRLYQTRTSRAPCPKEKNRNGQSKPGKTKKGSLAIQYILLAVLTQSQDNVIPSPIAHGRFPTHRHHAFCTRRSALLFLFGARQFLGKHPSNGVSILDDRDHKNGQDDDHRQRRCYNAALFASTRRQKQQ